MREVEFLPTWYPVVCRRKRLVWAQLAATGAVLLALTGATIARRCEVARQQAVADDYAAELQHFKPALMRLDALQSQQRQLRYREQLAAQTGLQLDPTRLLNVLEDAMPAKVSLTDLSLQAVETPGGGGDAQRRLSIRLTGLAPSDVEVVTLLTNLGKVKLLDDVAMDYTREHAGDGQATREFALTFAVNLVAVPAATAQVSPALATVTTDGK